MMDKHIEEIGMVDVEENLEIRVIIHNDKTKQYGIAYYICKCICKLLINTMILNAGSSLGFMINPPLTMDCPLLLKFLNIILCEGFLYSAVTIQSSLYT